jgi:hypothetical protein
VPGHQRIKHLQLIAKIRPLEPIEHLGEIDKIVTRARMPIVPSVSVRAATLPARSSMRSSDAFVVCASVIAARSPALSRRGNVPFAPLVFSRSIGYAA